MSVRVRPSRLLPEQVAGDHDALDLVRALVDLQRFGVADVALEGAARGGAPLAGQLKGVERDLHGRVGAVRLGDRSPACEGAPAGARQGAVLSNKAAGS